MTAHRTQRKARKRAMVRKRNYRKERLAALAAIGKRARENGDCEREALIERLILNELLRRG